ncbi:putative vacuolar membrane protein, partial [Pseudozyma hubeiensis]
QSLGRPHARSSWAPDREIFTAVITAGWLAAILMTATFDDREMTNREGNRRTCGDKPIPVTGLVAEIFPRNASAASGDSSVNGSASASSDLRRAVYVVSTRRAAFRQTIDTRYTTLQSPDKLFPLIRRLSPNFKSGLPGDLPFTGAAHMDSYLFHIFTQGTGGLLSYPPDATAGYIGKRHRDRQSLAIPPLPSREQREQQGRSSTTVDSDHGGFGTVVAHHRYCSLSIALTEFAFVLPLSGLSHGHQLA